MLHILMDLILTFLFYVYQTPGCDIPITTWISFFYFIQVMEILFEELRGRINESQYYDHFRQRRSIFKNSLIGLEGIIVPAFTIYGIVLFFSDKSQGCSDKNRSFVILMAILIVIGVLKSIVFVVSISIMAYVEIGRRNYRKNQANASVKILKSIQKISYKSLANDTEDTDKECVICYQEYGEDDTVSKLKCNEKHIFHT